MQPTLAIHRKQAFAAGAVAAVIVVVVWLQGWLSVVDALSGDLHFRYAGTIEANPRIVLIDINDHAMAEIGQWPWRRRIHADLVRTLHDLGARAIVMDLVFSDKTHPRRDGSTYGQRADADTGRRLGNGLQSGTEVNDDEELRAAFLETGSVYLAMPCHFTPPGVDRETLIDSAIELVRTAPAISLEAFRTRLPISSVEDVEAFFQEIRLTSLLEGDFALDAVSLSAQVGEASVRRHMPTAKKLAARRLADRYLSDHPDAMGSPLDASWPAFLESVLPGASDKHRSKDRQDLFQAFHKAMAHVIVYRRCPPLPPEATSRLAGAYGFLLPLQEFAVAARGVGLVSFQRNDGVGVVRSVPLVGVVGGRAFHQLGALVACDVVGIGRQELAVESNQLVLGTGRDARRFPLDSRGDALIYWHVPSSGDRWQDSFDHIPVTRVAEIPAARESMEQNLAWLAWELEGLMHVRHKETPATYNAYVAEIDQRVSLVRQMRLATDHAQHADLADRIRQADQRIRTAQDDALVWLRRMHQLWRDETPQTDEERASKAKILELTARLIEHDVVAEAGTLNARLADQIVNRETELRSRVSGAICFVGYTATALADMVTTPIYASMPGVMAHANDANMVLENRAVGRAPQGRCVALMLACALGAALAAANLRTGASVACWLVISAMLLVGGGAALSLFDQQWPTFSATIATAAAWGTAVVYRQATEQRARRHLQRALSQYTSPAIAARIATTAEGASLEPRLTQVSCYFCDLQGFTPLSARLGAARTRDILNPFLECVSDVIVTHGGLVNKFMGDGVFAFFNAPVRPCDNHAEMACASALAVRTRLADVNKQVSQITGGEPLVIRTGLATGSAFVGDYGSGTKLDYTCIGNVANLGARLEGANRVFGTSVLIDGATQAGAGPGFLFRTLGKVKVIGIDQPVDVFELAGLAEDASDEFHRYCVQFAQAIEYFQQRDWNACLAALGSCTSFSDRHDAAARVYESAAKRHQAVPPGDDFDGAIVVAVK